MRYTSAFPRIRRHDANKHPLPPAGLDRRRRSPLATICCWRCVRPGWKLLGGWPASVPLALAMFLLFFLLAAGYALAAGRADDAERA